ncbi:hypothetical protein GE061_010379 [Apolygus lucorum]|uniref:Kazal-like domain-containing protein n=1 Tax=Apolygus lucorum TaxID=248454 RepID=A0A6A4INY4_APOLU|nr:hypothetical protein GE061_010379 [Apolygus lucorum]
MTSGVVHVAVVTLLLGAAHGLPAKCKCDCQGTDLTCGKDLKTSAMQTFRNPCQLICQNCISNERWVPIKSGECDKVTRARRRPLPPQPPPPSPSAPGASTAPPPPTLSKIIAGAKQAASNPPSPTLAPTIPPKAVSSLTNKMIPSPPKSPNNLPPPAQQPSAKAQAIGG